MAADWDKLVKVPSKQHLVDIKSNVKNYSRPSTTTS